jgi:predicted dehydrogenase
MAVDRNIKIGIVGCGYGREVLAPAFRADPRATIVAVASKSRTNVDYCARELGIDQAFDDWRSMLDRRRIDAIVIATPPAVQSEIAKTAIGLGLPVFAEKPLALEVQSAASSAAAAAASGLANIVDFNFCEIDAWRAAQAKLRSGELGELRHVSVTWQVESYANRARLETWKTDIASGGGALFNFVSHSLHYLEWFLGPIRGLSARVAGMPNDTRSNDTFVAMAFEFACGAAGSLTMSTAAYLGSGHRLEFYGEHGTLVLLNTTADYMRGFSLFAGRRPDQTLTAIETPSCGEDRWADGRVLPTSRLAKRFLDWVDGGPPAEPNFAAGLRVQVLLDAARRSHITGQWTDTPASGDN